MTLPYIAKMQALCSVTDPYHLNQKPALVLETLKSLVGVKITKEHEFPICAVVGALRAMYPLYVDDWKREAPGVFERVGAHWSKLKLDTDRPGRNDFHIDMWAMTGEQEHIRELLDAAQRDDLRGETARWAIGSIEAQSRPFAQALYQVRPKSDLPTRFRENGYFVYNNFFSFVIGAKGFDRSYIQAQVDTMKVKITSELGNQSEDERLILEWGQSAFAAMINQCEQAVANGTAPEFVLETDKLTKIATFICGLTVPDFQGQPAPACRPRWSKGERGPVLDIVPVDPRNGWANIPNWSERDITEREI